MSRTALDDDAALMCRVRDGDDEAFRALYQRWRAPIVRFTVRFVGQQARGEELAQDVLMKVYRARHRYEPRERFAAWIYRIARNHCLNEVRRAEHRTGKVGLDETAEPPDQGRPQADALVAASRLQTAVREAVGRLPENQRAALIMQREEGMPLEDIAAALETTVGAVKALLNRARKKLMADLAPLLTAADPASAPAEAG